MNKWIVLTHKNPDGDAFGSAIALAILLDGIAVFSEKGWKTRPSVIAELCEVYRDLVMPHIAIGHIPEHDHIAVTDCGELYRIEFVEKALKKSAVIDILYDHHVTESSIAGINCLAPKCGSASAIIFDDVNVPEWEIKPASSLALAEALPIGTFIPIPTRKLVAAFCYAGHLSDTRRFQLGSRMDVIVAAAMVQLLNPAEYEFINNAYSQQTRVRQLLLAKLYTTAQLYGNAISANLTTTDLVDSTKSDTADLSTDLLMTAGMDAAVVNIQQPDGSWLYQFRTRGMFDGQSIKLATAHGGGGHGNMAGGMGSEPISAETLRTELITN